MEDIIKQINIFQLGNGSVGKVVVEKVVKFNENSQTTRINYLGVADSQKYLFTDSGLSIDELNRLKIETPRNIQTAKDYNGYNDIYNILEKHLENLIIIDTSATDKVTPFLTRCANNKCKLVLANKKPLAGKLDDFLEINKVNSGCRATVGAGLPIIPAIKKVLSNNEEIKKIEGCFSGSMGILSSELEKGRLFSDIIKESVSKGFTEPDPRIDLSGKDLANKILILARVSRINALGKNIQTEKLYPAQMEGMSKGDFILHTSDLNELFAIKYKNALKEKSTYKFMAIYENKKCSVVFNKILLNSDFGKLQNADKMAIITTNKQKIIVKGSGAGAKSAAQDVLDDILNYE